MRNATNTAALAADAATEPAPFPFAGTVSHGTHGSRDLITAFLPILRALDCDAPDAPRRYDMLRTDAAVMMIAKEWTESEESDASDIVSDLFDALDALAPDGYTFGAHEGDGSDFGFWEVDAEEDSGNGCDACEAAMINGVFCHETGCPNQGKVWNAERGAWIRYVECRECGSDVEEGEICDCTTFVEDADEEGTPEFDGPEYDVSEGLLSAIINGDWSGLEYDDRRNDTDDAPKLRRWLSDRAEEHGPGHWSNVDGESHWSVCDVLNLRANCAKLQYVQTGVTA